MDQRDHRQWTELQTCFDFLRAAQIPNRKVSWLDILRRTQNQIDRTNVDFFDK